MMFFSEPNYRYLVELLHVPLQSIYNWPYTMVNTVNGEDQVKNNVN